MMGVFVQMNVESRRHKSQPVGYVIQENGCWEWTGGIDRGGYGKWQHGKAHRVVYTKLRGPIPEGMQLDHRCRNRACVNPDHLEPVTNRENILRGNGHTAINARKQTCKRGHNDWKRTAEGGRCCVTCVKDRWKVRRLTRPKGW